MTALLAAGIPRLRVLRSVLVAVIAVSLLAAVNRELVIPHTRQHLATDSKNLAGQGEVDMQSRFDSHDVMLGGEKIVFAEQKIVNPNFVLPPGLDRYGRQLSAAEARYLPADGELPSGSLLSGVTAPKVLLGQPSLAHGEEAVIVTPHDATWLQPDQLFVVSGVSFELLSAGSTW